MFCAYTSKSGQTGLSTTYCVETPMKLESAIVPVMRLRPPGMPSASSAWVRVIFSGRTPTSTLPPAVVGAEHRVPGSSRVRSPAFRTMSSPFLVSICASMRLEVPRKFATKVVCGFS